MTGQTNDTIAIRFDSDFGDLLHAAYVYDSRELFPTRRLLFDEAVALVAGAVLYYLHHEWWILIVCALVFPAMRLALYPIRRMQMKPMYQSKIARGPFAVTFDSRGMVSQAGEARVELPWSHIQKMIESPRCILLVYCSRGYATIPKSAFADAAELDRFRELALSHIGENK